MSDAGMLEEFLAGAWVDAAVFALRPDYRAVLLAVDGLVPAPGDQDSDTLLAGGGGRRPRGAQRPGRPRICRTWRPGGRPTGRSGPSRSAPATAWRRCCAARASGLPRVNRLTDYYNAVSVLHQIPVGGEDLTRYAGPPRLIRATGDEPFDTTADGVAVTEHPEAGEVVWCDDAGVTCRRWNWRQARRTQLREDTGTALFILDALDPVTGQALHAAADDLAARLARLGPDVRAARRLIAAGPAPDEGD